MAVKKDFSALRASGSKIVTAVGYTAAATQEAARALLVGAVRLNSYLESDMDANAKQRLIQIDNELSGK